MLVTQALFCEGSSDDLVTCPLFSQAICMQEIDVLDLQVHNSSIKLQELAGNYVIIC